MKWTKFSELFVSYMAPGESTGAIRKIISDSRPKINMGGEACKM
jgi:hypothetical protein